MHVDALLVSCVQVDATRYSPIRCTHSLIGALRNQPDHLGTSALYRSIFASFSKQATQDCVFRSLACADRVELKIKFQVEPTGWMIYVQESRGNPVTPSPRGTFLGYPSTVSVGVEMHDANAGKSQGAESSTRSVSRQTHRLGTFKTAPLVPRRTGSSQHVSPRRRLNRCRKARRGNALL